MSCLQSVTNEEDLQRSSEQDRAAHSSILSLPDTWLVLTQWSTLTLPMGYVSSFNFCWQRWGRHGLSKPPHRFKSQFICMYWCYFNISLLIFHCWQILYFHSSWHKKEDFWHNQHNFTCSHAVINCHLSNILACQPCCIKRMFILYILKDRIYSNIHITYLQAPPTNCLTSLFFSIDLSCK